MKRLLVALSLLTAFPAFGQQVPILAQDGLGTPMQDFLRMGSMHRVLITNVVGGTSPTQIDPLNANVRAVMVSCTVACFISQRASPAAATNIGDFLLPANVLLRLKAFQTDSIGFLSATAGGVAYVVEMN